MDVSGILSYLAGFVIMAGIYAVVCAGAERPLGLYRPVQYRHCRVLRTGRVHGRHC